MTTTDYRVEHDSMGALDVPAHGAVGRPDPARDPEFPAERPAHAARVHSCARA